MRAAARCLVLLAGLVLLLLLGTALPASAHPTLLSTTPEAGYSVGTTPDRITLVFDEPVTVDPRAVRLENDGGEPVATSEVSREQGDRRLTVSVLDDLPAGRYVVRWRVTAQDGDVVDSGFDFAVATRSAGLQGRQDGGTAGLPLVAALRWLFFLGLVGLVGGLVGERLAGRTIPDAARPRSLVRPAAAVGLLATVGLLMHLTLTANGGRAGYLLALEAAGLLTIVLAGDAARWWFSTAAVLIVVGAESVRNHLGTQHGAAGAVVLATHLLAISGWIGTLVHLLRVAGANRGGTVQLRPAFLGYARLALALLLVVAATGTVGALLLVPTLYALTGTAYGRTLLTKLALVAVVAALAWSARRRLARSPSTVEKVARLEAITLVAVLAVTAVLISLPTPAPATRDLGYPPPATGPVLRLGTLAGQVAVAIAASENQLEVRLRVPDDQVQSGDSEPPDYHLTARTTAGGEAAATVPLRPCGPGCYVGPVPWRTGTNYVDIRVDAPGWHGGAAVFGVEWVPRTLRDVLPQVRATMLAQRRHRST